MRAGRVALLSLVLLAPLALADSIHHSDALRDERTVTNLQTYDEQPNPIECHDASIDVASIVIERGEAVRVTYSFLGPIAASALACNDHALPPTEREWGLHLGGTTYVRATVTAGGVGAPTASCLRAYNDGIGASNGCIAPVHVASHGFWFELPLEGTFTFETGQPGSYSLAGELYARVEAGSRHSVGFPPLQRTLYGAFDLAETMMG